MSYKNTGFTNERKKHSGKISITVSVFLNNVTIPQPIYLQPSRVIWVVNKY